MTKHKEDILRLRAEGKSYNEIKNELGCSKGTIAYHCGEGQKPKYAESSRQSRERTYKKYYALKSGPCVDCGEVYLPTLMHFDHMGEDKTAMVSWLRCNSGWDTVVKEVAKCELVCSNCHGYRTAERNIANGTASAETIEYYKKDAHAQKRKPIVPIDLV